MHFTTGKFSSYKLFLVSTQLLGISVLIFVLRWGLVFTLNSDAWPTMIDYVCMCGFCSYVDLSVFMITLIYCWNS